MATWETTANSTLFSNGVLIRGDQQISKITDTKDNETAFEIGEDITVTNRSTGADHTGYKFDGTYTFNGMVYPVISSGTSRWVVGLRFDTPSIQRTLATSDLDTTGPLTECFFPGTLVATPSGERKIEELVYGDLVLTGDSGQIPATWFGRKFARSVSIKWIGWQTVSTLFGPTDRLMPVRFAAGSLGWGEGGQPLLPHSELTVTADHAMLVDGVLCEAGALVNGTTITRVPLAEFGKSYMVYHVETEAHEIILANGAPSETFIDNVSRRAFDNYAEFARLHGDPQEMKELPYPRASNARHLPMRIKSRLGIAASTQSAKIA